MTIDFDILTKESAIAAELLKEARSQLNVGDKFCIIIPKHATCRSGSWISRRFYIFELLEMSSETGLGKEKCLIAIDDVDSHNKEYAKDLAEHLENTCYLYDYTDGQWDFEE